MAALDYLRRAGLAVEVIGDKLRLRPVERITDSVRQFVCDHKAEIQAELIAANESPPGQGQSEVEADRWLNAVAHLLECSPAYLLKHDFIDRHDLAEQYDTPPHFAAKLIQSNPAWAVPAAQEIAIDTTAG